MKKSHLLFVTMAIVTAVVMFFMFPKQQAQGTNPINGFILPTPMAINSFQLKDNHNKTFTENNLKNHWTLMFFGFTNCGMVCPTTLAELNKMYKKIMNAVPADQVPHVVMVSVDPDRDSVQRMNEYITAFNSQFIGTRADIKETVALEKQLHIASAKIEADGKGKNHYTINHTADILVFNPSGKLVALLSYPHNADQMAKDYKFLIAH